MLKWPTKVEVDRATREWARRETVKHPELLRAGYFGSYARGDWGVGSDLDLVAVVTESGEAFENRSLSWDLSGLPLPTDLLIYTEKEWRQMAQQDSRFTRQLMMETTWVYPPQEG